MPHEEEHRTHANERPPDHGQADNGHGIGADEAINRMTVPLTVIHGHVQLLQRRLERGQVVGGAELRQALAQMETATRVIIAELHAARAASPPRTTGDAA